MDFNLEQYTELLKPASINEHGLTARQTECLYHITKGLRAKEIAHTLNLSTRTVEHHIEAIKRKLNCYSRAYLVARALEMPEIKNKL